MRGMMRRAASGLKAAPALLFVAAVASPMDRAIDLPGDRLFPENLDIASDGTAYVGSLTGGVLRVDLATGKVAAWLKPGGSGTASTFGILRDDVNRLLWVCNNDLTAQGIAIAGADKGAVLKGLDPQTGAARVSLALPGAAAFCNDIAVAKDGTVYVSDSGRSHILRWTPGGKALEDWFFDQRLASAAHDNGGLDGIAFDRAGNLVVNNFRLNTLARIAIAPDGAPGAVTLLATSRPLDTPDGLRPLADGRFVMAEKGRVALVEIAGDTARVTTLGEGYGAVSGVAPHAGHVWLVAGEASYVFRPDLRGKAPPLPFRLSPVTLP
jgi:sugar lactone lactonase YvrE